VSLSAFSLPTGNIALESPDLHLLTIHLFLTEERARRFVRKLCAGKHVGIFTSDGVLAKIKRLHKFADPAGEGANRELH
jgi:hypothetical protein